MFITITMPMRVKLITPNNNKFGINLKFIYAQFHIPIKYFMSSMANNEMHYCSTNYFDSMQSTLHNRYTTILFHILIFTSHFNGRHCE